MHHFITGIAGFIGSQLADRLLAAGERVSGVDDLSLGRLEHLDGARANPAFRFAQADCSDRAAATQALREAADWGGKPDIVWHLAANSDIAAGVADASIDFDRTLRTTFAMLEAVKAVGVTQIAFASTSAVYGERDDLLTEDSGPLLPISNYGATKLASEALLSAAAESFVERLWIFRFPNVVGPRATHGAIHDFIGRLRDEPARLTVLGDGTQTKPYLHVCELLDAMRFIVGTAKARRNVLNIGPEGPGTSVAFMAEQTVARVAQGAAIAYTGGDRGWVGDVPRFHYSTERLAALGWRPRLSSNEAVLRAIAELGGRVIGHLVIVAGGKGTRLAGVAGDLPKALVPVGGKPVLQHQLELAAVHGVTGATIFAGHLADKIAAFVGDGSRFGLHAEVLVEDEPLGNAGAVIQALDRLPEQFFVVYGDVMLAVDLAAMARAHLARGADFTTLVHPNDHPHDSDLIEADAEGWVSAIHTYPHPADRFFANSVNAALYVARREALAPFAGPGKRDFTKDVMPGLIASGGKVLAYGSSEYIKDMGTPARLERVEKDLKSGKLDPAAGAALAPAVFLDRDGTINRDTGFLASHDGLELLDGAGAALRALRQGGYRLVVVTNQPVIARGEASEADVAAIHRKLEWELGKQGAFVDAIYHCPHHPDGGFPGERPELKGPCDCRKPGTAMVEQACREHRLDPARSWMVGDQTADIELARRAGLRSVLVRTGSAGRDGKYTAAPDFAADDLAAAAELILGAA